MTRPYDANGRYTGQIHRIRCGACSYYIGFLPQIKGRADEIQGLRVKGLQCLLLEEKVAERSEVG